jgi:hypothetical protein
MRIMAVRPLAPRELARTPTVFSNFMGAEGEGYKTVGQLLAIYRSRRMTLPPAEDPADDLRVERFIDDMSGRRWSDDVLVQVGVFGGTQLVIDGIHRGIAYLACIERGMSPERLPALHVNC